MTCVCLWVQERAETLLKALKVEKGLLEANGFRGRKTWSNVGIVFGW